MSVFRINSCSRLDSPSLSTFTVTQIQGEIQVGERFLCFDTHHPREFQVTEIQTKKDVTQIICTGSTDFDDQFAGATIDTSERRRPAAFRYDPPATVA